MRIIQIIPNLRKGGAERLVLDICEELQKKHDVMLLCLTPENEYLNQSRIIKNIQISNTYFYLSVFKSKKSNLQRLYEIINEFKPDIIHTHLIDASLAARIFPQKNVSYFSTFHDNIEVLKKPTFSTFLSKNGLIKFYSYYYLMRLYRKCNNFFIANSLDTFRYFKNNLSCRLTTNLTYFDNCINIKRFNLDKEYVPLKGRQIKLISIGSLVKKKNHSYLVEVVSILRNKGVDVSLTILGEGIERQELENIIVSKKLTNYIKLLGLVDEVENELLKADIYVHSAIYEPFGLVLVEAMVQGLPIVMLDAGGNEVLGYHNKNGYVYPKDTSPFNFSEGVINIIENETLYLDFSNFSKKVANNYSIESYCAILEDFYKKSISGQLSFKE